MTAGEQLRRNLEAEAEEADAVYDQREQALIEQACQTADLIAALEAVIAEEGVTATRRGGKVVHQCVREVRLQRAVLQRLLAGLDFATEAATSTTTGRARKAANARWNGRGRPQKVAP